MRMLVCLCVRSSQECGDQSVSDTLHHYLAYVLSTLPADTRDAIKMAAKLRATANNEMGKEAIETQNVASS